MSQKVRLFLYILRLLLVLLLIGIACAAPFTTDALLGYKPITDSMGQWFERTGAVTSIFSLLAMYLLDDTMNMLVDPRKNAELVNIKIYNALETPAGVLKALGFMAALIGTAIWGYGTIILTFMHKAV